jgi:ArsR family transcriptional regulator
MANQSIYDIQAELCQAMSHAVRIEIVHVLRESPKRVNDIAQITHQPQSLISRHLSVLRHAGIVTAQRRGQDIIYQIANPKISDICDLMRQVLTEEISLRSQIFQDTQDDL